MVLDMLNYFGKIFAGGFFRTLGKIFAYILIGFLIMLLASKFNLMQVKAETQTSLTYNSIFGTYVDSYVQFKDLKTGSIYGSDYKANTDVVDKFSFFYSYHSLPSGFSSSTDGLAISSCSNSFKSGNYYSIILYYIVTPNFYVHNSYAKGNNYVGVGSSWNGSFGDFGIVPTYYYSGVSNSLFYDNYYITYNSITFKANQDGSCVAFPVNKSGGGLNSSNFKYVGLRLLYQGTEPPSNAEVTSLITQESAIINSNIDSMKEKQEETNQKLDKLDSTMKDDSVDNNQASGFFDSFDNIDHGGISGVITAPLSAINKINQPCSAININLWDKDITLPCGDTLFWNKENVSSFRGVWNILVGGPIIYLLMVKLYHVIQNLKNPDDSRVEVAKL